eukprot:g35908.t1
MKKVFGMLAFIGQNLDYRSWAVMLQLYRALIRRLLECCIQFRGLEGLNYRERLNRLGVFSLERQGLRRDLTEVYKIMRGINKMSSQGLFPRLGDSKTREHRFK